ncbi:outer membrane protein assembly factor BamB [Neptunomonas sp. XY-337]|uniref:outer membrane protein assembly factor BamB n=1 Tax=Neptunomonas sp. XY-337 TaxID=2561897 RepID=UPI0010AA2D4E|nr:outer membrane protein assembly factor BamB [Neptunomonas sp. XY-337]
MFKRISSVLLLSAAISGCSLWGGSDEVEPSPLVDFDAEKQVIVEWSRSIGGDLGDKFHQLAATISGDQIYAVSADGSVGAFALDDGEPRWEIDLDEAISAGAGAGDNKVVVVTEQGEAICLDALTGGELWRKQLATEVTAEPQLNNELVVVQLINGSIVALDSDTGVTRWRYDSLSPRLTLRGTSAPIVALDVTLAGLDNGKFVALDNASGATLWEQTVSYPEGRSELERMTDIDGRPMLYEKVMYIPSFQGDLVAINPFNAQTLWKKKLSSYRSLASGFGNVYVSEANDHVQALDAKNAASVWSQSQLENRMLSAPAAFGNVVAVGDREGYIHFLSQIDGRFIARYDADAAITSDMKTRGNRLFVLTDSGRLLALTLK